MKKLICFVTMLVVFACDKTDEPDPKPAEEVKQQAPFEGGEVDVKINKVLFNGLLEAEYLYDGNLLAEERRFVAAPSPMFSQTGVFKRSNGVLQNYEVKLRALTPAGQNPADTLKPYFSLNYAPVISDSLREVTREDLQSGAKTLRIYAFDKTGYITRQELWNENKTEKTTFAYTRNDQHNVLKSSTNKQTSTIKDETQYLYDDHPNPFFKLGRDAYGEISIRSLSPNNPVKETRSLDNVVISNTNYTYEYLPNGYPKKVTVRVESTSFPPYSYTMDFIY
ncbi:hypothetical protein [Dyadobacter sp. CY326]|uniref:hypothetical protein n=1 Tax=Dyadobacter sp. CY326 TaxID=2907300 RepID=UPI001F1E2020|nr:hypothetical protein [Dyadobacter sp. CY326]MCE7063907.1 hypothetical protein [Dyadobacter sp. CY326]